jgi:hypothetical protein
MDSLSAIDYSNWAIIWVVSAIWDYKEEIVSSQSAWLVALALSYSSYWLSMLSMI